MIIYLLCKNKSEEGETNMEVYCVKCKKKQEAVDMVDTVLKNGKNAVKGRCGTCSTAVFQIVGKK